MKSDKAFRDFGSIVYSEFCLMPNKFQELFFQFMFDKYDEPDQFINDFLSLYSIDCYEEIKSPIEQIFAFAYKYVLYREMGFPDMECFDYTSQKEIIANGNKYIVDFYYRFPSGNGSYDLIVECDGHEFHQKTKKQVEHDNNRDYDLKSCGYDVIHFSGSQIYNDPVGCAYKVFNYIMKKFRL